MHTGQAGRTIYVSILRGDTKSLGYWDYTDVKRKEQRGQQILADILQAHKAAHRHTH